MGFRFSRRIGILPGLKLNFSGSGVSLSAGVRGAHLNFGSRGTYASVGLPGTGMSYRQRIGGTSRSYSAPAPALTEDQIKSIGNRENDQAAVKLFQEGTQNMAVSPEEARRYIADPRFKMMDPDTGRRLTSAKLETMIAANELKEKLEHLQVQLQTEAEEYQHLLNFWKPLPAIASAEEWQTALNKRPFQSQIQPPTPPDMEVEQAKLLDELTANEHTGINKFLPGFVARSDAKTDLIAAWPEREAQMQQQYNDQIQQYEQAVAAESGTWDETEAKRIDWVQKLLAGDLQEIDHTMAEVLTGLQLPFKTHCDYFLHEADTVCLHLDLPEIEDVIPETVKAIQKNGTAKDVRRDQAERQSDYAQLVMGQCLFLAAELFSYLPVTQQIRVAAYTQRPRIKESDPVDSYVLDVAFDRDAVKTFGSDDNLKAFFVRQGARFNQCADGELKRIEPPSWLQHEDYRHL